MPDPVVETRLLAAGDAELEAAKIGCIVVLDDAHPVVVARYGDVDQAAADARKKAAANRRTYVVFRPYSIVGPVLKEEPRGQVAAQPGG